MSINGKHDIDKILDSRTIQISDEQRVRIRKGATATLKTHAGDRTFVPFKSKRTTTRSEKLLEDVQSDYIVNPAKYGKDVSTVLDKELSREQKQTLLSILDDQNERPFVILRNIFPTRVRRSSYTRSNDWYVRDFVYEILSSGLIHTSSLGGITHRLREAGDDLRPWQDFRTQPNAQKTMLNDGGDLPLRYRQATPDLKFPGEAGAGHLAATRLVVFACFENPIADQIWLLPTVQIFNGLDPRDATLLNQTNYRIFDHWSPNLWPHHGDTQRIIYDHGDHKKTWLSLDINRVYLPSEGVPGDEHRQALAALLDRVNDLDRSHAIPVTLNRGDALITDNYRILYRRREQDYSVLSKPTWFRPRVRWLRAYYGFPQSH